MTELRSALDAPVTPENEKVPHEPSEDAHPYEFHPSKWGFCLGGVVLGATGCILGACMHYEYPVAVAISVLWWGIYLGCLGASIGALFGLCRDRTPGPALSRQPQRRLVRLHNKAGNQTPRFAAAREYVGSASSHFTSPEGP